MMTSEQIAKLDEIKKTAPVDVASAASALGLAVYSMKLAPGVSGVLLKDTAYNTPSGFVILVAEGEATVRQRFSAAHEIGHFVMHPDEVMHRDRPVLGDEPECGFAVVGRTYFDPFILHVELEKRVT